MTEQTKQRTFRKLMIAYSIFEMLFCSGPIFGWASLAYILKKENYFGEYCEVQIQQNSSSINRNAVCREQENRLNIAYTVGFITVGLVSFPVGYLLDTFGPKITRYASRYGKIKITHKLSLISAINVKMPCFYPV